jgi:hypothetical protein
MIETDEIIKKNLCALQQLITAVALINEVNNTNTSFTDDILPSCTEEFIEQLAGKLNAIGLFLESL